MRSYYLSAAGRRTTLMLLVAAVAIWIFALWSLSSTLTLSYAPLQFWPSLNATLARGLSMSQLVPALLMLVVIVATPLLIWNLLEEWAALYTPTAEGLRFESLGIVLLCTWDSLQALHTLDDSDEPHDELELSSDPTLQIRNPVLRLLHTQAYGRTRLPIYAGLADREQLLSEIRSHLSCVEPQEVAVLRG